MQSHIIAFLAGYGVGTILLQVGAAIWGLLK